MHWNQALKQFQTVTPDQANRHARDPLRWVESYQIDWLKKIIFPAIAQLLSALGSEEVVYIGPRDFELPSTNNNWDPVITPAMLEVVRRRYSIDAAGKEVESDPLDSLAVAFQNIEPNPVKRVWTVIVHPSGHKVKIYGLEKDCCLEFR
jgi:hypothetical protein